MSNPEIARAIDGLADEQWFETIVRSLTDPTLGLPGFPAAEAQVTSTGQSGAATLKDAFAFYKFVKNNTPPWDDATALLDFGVGWGRILRFFMKDLQNFNLFGADVNAQVIAQCKAIGVPGDLRPIDPDGTLPFPSESFDIICAYSVFSHLSERSARHWLAELVRAARPGGTLFLTTTTDRFLNLCLACHAKSDRNSYEAMLAALFADPGAIVESYRRGHFAYAAVGGDTTAIAGSNVPEASNYGWAAMPAAWVERELGALAKIAVFVDDPSQFEQGLFVIRKA
jgi:SAM-dependent methyltransferase